MGIFSKSAQQYDALKWIGNTFKGNIQGKEQLLNVTEEKKLPEERGNNFPWNFLKEIEKKIKN
ncbi:hypothetical protein D3C85_1870000 [compost metagenome]